MRKLRGHGNFFDHFRSTEYDSKVNNIHTHWFYYIYEDARILRVIRSMWNEQAFFRNYLKIN